jgi:hypothetical protein
VPGDWRAVTLLASFITLKSEARRTAGAAKALIRCKMDAEKTYLYERSACINVTALVLPKRPVAWPGRDPSGADES